MPRTAARSRPLTLPRLLLYVFLSPLIIVGVGMLAVLAFGALSIVIALIARAFA